MFEWGKKTYVMGIINLTPDSFSHDGTMLREDPVTYAVKQAKQFINEGADILDIGAESSRPGSRPISGEEEIERLLPVLKTLKEEQIEVIISIDTYKAKVAQVCLENDADWINDIWGLQKDPQIAAVVSAHNVPIVLMHNRCNADAVEKNERLGASYDGAKYIDFPSEIKNELNQLANDAISAGISKNNIILDPGIGFGKTVQQNIKLINCLDKIKLLGYPVLIGPSRKSFIGNILDLPVEERMEGTAASIAIGIARGADIIRVHDVKYMARISAMTDALVRNNCAEK